jgi:AcrR family transcriptional regulator
MSLRREELTKIAGDLFAQKGFSATTVRGIADEAGILPGSLYHHFDSKEDIARVILTEHYDERVRQCRAIAASDLDPREALAELIRSSFRSIATNPQAVGLIQNSGDLIDRFAHVQDVKEELKDIWIEVLNRGVRRHVLRDEIHATLVRRFIRDSIAATVSWWRPDGVLTIDEVADSYIDMIYNGLLTTRQPNVRPPTASTMRANDRRRTSTGS